MANQEASTPRRRSYPKVILVTDPAYDEALVLDVVTACARAIPRGEFAVQLRDKKKDPRAVRAFAERLREATRSDGALLLINGNAALAKDVGADGVHVGGGELTVGAVRDVVGRAALVTIAAHSDQAVQLGAADGADGALVSAIFPSPGKAVGRGVQAIRSARAAVGGDFLIYALGGVERSNTAECLDAGADGVAAIRALLLASDPGAEARGMYEFTEEFRRAVQAS